jgi:glycosyltransferase involved in cell wall biosynthesis
LRPEVDGKVELVELVRPSVARQPRTQQLRRSLVAYRQETRRWRPDILFSAGNHGHLLSTLAWTGLPGIKILRISNDLKRAATRLSPLRRLIRSAKFRIMASLADRLVFVSRAMERNPVMGSMVQRGRAVVIPNGVDIDRVRAGLSESCSHPWIASANVPVVLAVGRHVPQKNFRVLIEAFALARQHRPMRLLFLGEGKESAIAELRAAAAELGVADDIGFEPPTKNPFSFICGADVVALPSLWEGSANVLLEALACGTPVIASRTAGDAALVLDDGRYGVLVDPDDRAGIAAAILRQISSDAVLPGDRAESVSRQVSLERYLKLFVECLSEEATTASKFNGAD